jgi:lipopolysaccharide export system permease protein
MKLLDKYLLRNHLVSVGYCLFAFFIIFVLIDLFESLSKILEASVPLHLLLLYCLCRGLPALETIMPAALMLGTLYTLWHFTRNNEIMAMRTSGLSFYRILAPFLAVGFAASLLTAAVKEAAAPRAVIWANAFSKQGFRSSDRQILMHTVYYNDAANRTWSIDVFDLKHPNVLRNVKIVQERPDGTRLKEIVSPHAEWLDGRWWLHDMQVRFFDKQDNPAIANQIPAAALREVPELNERPSNFADELRRWEYLSSLQMRRYLRRHRSMTKDTRLQMEFDIQARLAAPWACLVATLFAVPVGAVGRRQSPITGILMAIAFLFAYYALGQVGLFLGKRQVVWPWFGAWFSNIAFLLAGLRVLIKMR